jgi:DNA-binding winged helix-turn-helix (wHTH) protein
MKIVISTENYEILNSVIRAAKEQDDTVFIAKMEKTLIDHIDSEKIDAFIISGNRHYGQKAIDFIKSLNPYTPIVIIAHDGVNPLKRVDSVVPFHRGNDTDLYGKALIHNIHAYCKNFETLQRLTAKMGDILEFGVCSYDPTKRFLFQNGIKIQKLSPKQAGIFELLAANFGKVVKKDIILEKVWHDSNYFVGRSLDVFVTHLRKILKDGEVNMTITNVSNIGLMLDNAPRVK